MFISVGFESVLHASKNHFLQLMLRFSENTLLRQLTLLNNFLSCTNENVDAILRPKCHPSPTSLTDAQWTVPQILAPSYLFLLPLHHWIVSSLDPHPY